MAAPLPKRKRADTAAIPNPGPADNRYLGTILSLPAVTIASLVSSAADKHPDIATTIAGLLSCAAGKYPDVAATIPASKGRAEAAAPVEAKDSSSTSKKVIDFDHYSKTAWRAINTHSKSCIMDIRRMCPAEASYGTKKSALETLRKIGKTGCVSGGDVIGSEVQKGFQWDACLEDTMFGIVQTMTQQERDMIMKGDFGVKLEELVELSKDYCLFETLDEVLALLEGTEKRPRDAENPKGTDEDDSADDSRKPRDREELEDHDGTASETDSE
ncbi:hypothetical protein MMC26_001992 [Xylographa opegraphella]|nr:hypothetical protein [Xylographa opegraphella]